MRRLLAVIGVLVVLGGCGAASSDSTPSLPAAGSETSASAQEPVTVPIVIAGGEVTPLGKEVEARVGQPIVLQVTSDAADELHVHAQPDQTFEVKAAADQRFEFTVEVPGQVAVELHHLGVTPVELVVRP